MSGFEHGKDPYVKPTTCYFAELEDDITCDGDMKWRIDREHFEWGGEGHEDCMWICDAHDMRQHEKAWDV
jgi:hypothetical protein